MDSRRRLRTIACMAALAALAASSVARAADGDWLTYNRTLAGDRFSPLTEINRSNVASQEE